MTEPITGGSACTSCSCGRGCGYEWITDRIRAGLHIRTDLTAQRTALEKLGVNAKYIYTDHGLTGTNRERPRFRIALAACREGDTLVVAKLDRLARSLRDASDIVDELTAKGVKLSIGGSVHDPLDPVGRLLFNVLAMVVERPTSVR